MLYIRNPAAQDRDEAETSENDSSTHLVKQGQKEGRSYDARSLLLRLCGYLGTV
jgi:hypothetical protein